MNELDHILDEIERELKKLDKRLDEAEEHVNRQEKRLDEKNGRRKDVQRKADEGMAKPKDTDGPAAWDAWERQQEFKRGMEGREESERNGVTFREGGKVDDSVKELVEGVRSRVRAESRCDAATFEQFEAAQVKAEKAANVWGFGADRWGQNEKLSSYRLRLLQPFLKYSPEWKNADLRQVAQAGALSHVEDSIFKSAIAAATSNATFKNTLHKVEMKDQSGRNVTKFFGDPEACWGMFKIPARRVMGFRTGLNEAKLQKI